MKKVFMLALIPILMQQQQRKFLIVAASDKKEMTSKQLLLMQAFHQQDFKSVNKLNMKKVFMLALIPILMQQQQRKFLINAASHKEEMASKPLLLTHAFLPTRHHMCK